MEWVERLGLGLIGEGDRKWVLEGESKLRQDGQEDCGMNYLKSDAGTGNCWVMALELSCMNRLQLIGQGVLLKEKGPREKK